MTAVEIVLAARGEGVIVALSPSGSIKAIGEQSAVNRWRSILSGNKTDIVNLLNNRQADALVSKAEVSTLVSTLVSTGVSIAVSTDRAGTPPFPLWCDPHCECLCRLKLPGLEIVQGCYQESGSTHWRWSRLDKINNCPKAMRN